AKHIVGIGPGSQCVEVAVDAVVVALHHIGIAKDPVGVAGDIVVGAIDTGVAVATDGVAGTEDIVAVPGHVIGGAKDIIVGGAVVDGVVLAVDKVAGARSNHFVGKTIDIVVTAVDNGILGAIDDVTGSGCATGFEAVVETRHLVAAGGKATAGSHAVAVAVDGVVGNCAARTIGGEDIVVAVDFIVGNIAVISGADFVAGTQNGVVVGRRILHGDQVANTVQDIAGGFGIPRHTGHVDNITHPVKGIVVDGGGATGPRRIGGKEVLGAGGCVVGNGGVTTTRGGAHHCVVDTVQGIGASNCGGTDTSCIHGSGVAGAIEDIVIGRGGAAG